MTLDVIAEAGVAIRPLVDDFESDLIDQLGPPAEKAGEDAGEKTSEGYNKTLVKGLTKAAAVVAGAAGLIARSWNEGVNTIRRETGATGDVLDDLVQSARNVNTEVVTSFTEVSETISALRQRTELTGPALEALTKQIVQLSELTGGDASDSVEGIIDLFKVWQVETADQAGLLDLLYATSQQTGQGIDALIGALSAGVGPLTNFGFTLEQAIAFIGQIESEGGNAPKVIAALQVAFVKLSQTSKDPERALSRLAERIKEAESPAKATRIAVEALGSRAGPQLAGQIRKGRFEVQDFLKALRASKETIAGAREDTTTLGDKFNILRKRVADTVAPWAQAIAIGATVVTAIGPTIELINKYEKLSQTMKVASLSAGLLAAAIAATVIVANKLSDEGIDTADAKQQIDDLTLALKKGQISWEDYIRQSEEIAGSTTEIGDATDVIQRMQENLDKLGIEGPEDLKAVKDEFGRTEHKAEQTQKSIRVFAGLTRKELREWRHSSKNSLSDISGAFGKLQDDAKITADELIHAFKKQRDAARDFRENLKILIRRGAKPEFIKDLIDMGQQGALWAQGLAEDNKKTTKEFFNTKEKAGNALDSLTGLVAKAERGMKRHGSGIRDSIHGIGHAASRSRDEVENLTVSLDDLLARAAQYRTLDFPNSVPAGSSTRGTPRRHKNGDGSGKGGG